MDIKELRKRTGLSQARFSEKYGMSRRTLQNWEEGSRTPAKYILDLLAFKVDADCKKDKKSL